MPKQSIRALLVVVAAIVFIAPAGWLLFARSSPTVLISNKSSFTATVKIETDVGESYPTSRLEPGETQRIAISGRDKLLWLVAHAEGKSSLASAKLYITSSGTVYADLSENSLSIRYEI